MLMWWSVDISTVRCVLHQLYRKTTEDPQRSFRFYLLQKNCVETWRMFEFGADGVVVGLLLMLSAADILKTQLNHCNHCLYVIGEDSMM